MKSTWMVGLSLVAVLALVVGLKAEDKKEEGKDVTLKGTVCCAKCELKEADKCATVIKVTEGDQKGVYYFDKDSHKKNHKAICETPTEGSVTGVIGEKDGKKTITVSKVELKK